MRRGRSSRGLLVAGAVIGAVALFGCSSSGDTPQVSESPAAEPNGVQELSAKQILARVQDAVAAATSVRVAGSIIQGGSSLDVNLQLGADGSASGSLAGNGQLVQILAIDGTVYASADEAFWAGQVDAQAAAQLANKYVEVPADNNSLNSFSNYDAFIGQLVSPEGTVTKGDQTTVDGVDVIELIDSKGEGVLSISLVGEPLPVKVGSPTAGELNLTDWSAAFTVTAPAPSDIVDPSTIPPSTPGTSGSPSP